MLKFDLHKSWQHKARNFELHLQMEVPRGEIMGIMGPSGVGKTTLFHLLAGLSKPDKGFISLGEQFWYQHDKGIFLPPQKRKLAYLFQGEGLFPHMTLQQNLEFATLQVTDLKSKYKLMGLEGLQNRYPHQLSGGQRQRGALLRAILQKPDVLLLDEPFTALDTEMRQQIRGIFHEWIRPMQIPVLIASHDPEDILNLAERMVYLNSGKVSQLGLPQEILLPKPASLLQAKVIGQKEGQLIVKVGQQKIYLDRQMPVEIGQKIEIEIGSGYYRLSETPRESEDS